MKINIVDIETCGFKIEDPIVEIGIVQLNLATGAIVTVYDELVKERHFSYKHKEGRYGWIFKNSCLNFEDVMNAKPLDFNTIQHIFDSAPTTAYNKKFDMKFLGHRGFKIIELECPMLASVSICNLKTKTGKPKWPKVEEAWKHFFPEKKYIEKHRGADDAFHEAKIVYELYKMGKFKIQNFSI